VYAKMKTGPSFSGTYQFVPTDWRLECARNVATSMDKETKVCTITWECYNGDLDETMTLQRRLNDGKWEDIHTWNRPSDYEYSYVDTLTGNGLYTYRIKEYTYKRSTHYSGFAFATTAYSSGTKEVQYGTVQTMEIDAIDVGCIEQEERPIAFMGMSTNANSTVGLVPFVSYLGKDKFTFSLKPWNYPETTSISKVEGVDYLLMKPGQYKWGDMRAEVDTCCFVNDSGKEVKVSRGETIEVTFKEPFPEGVTPVVLLQPKSGISSAIPVVAKLFDVTNTGFRMKLMKQNDEEKNIISQSTFYIAITPGCADLNETGMSIYAGLSENKVGGSVNSRINFLSPEGEQYYLNNPYVIAQPQSHNLDFVSLFRRVGDVTTRLTDDEGNKWTATTAIRVRRLMDTSLTSSEIGLNSASTNGDYIGWIAINHGEADKETAVGDIQAEEPRQGGNAIYDLSGRRVQNPSKGIYIVNGKKMLIR